MTKTTLGVGMGAVLAFSLLAASPAFASENHHNDCGCSSDTDNSVNISVQNSGAVFNFTGAFANSGGNLAGGSYGGNGGEGGEGGNGGDAEVDGYGLADAGNGGDGGYGGQGGNGGPGGLVDTGDASADAGSMNQVNSVDIDVEQADCGCDEEVDGWYDSLGNFHPFKKGDTDNSVNIEVDQEGVIEDMTMAGANSGMNAADGSFGGNGGEGAEGGNGGDAEAAQGGDWNDYGNGGCGCNNDVYPGEAYGGDAGMGGPGGNGGSGDVGGTIRTGRATANAGSINVVNTAIVRVR